jgi:hypothetical protein
MKEPIKMYEEFSKLQESSQDVDRYYNKIIDEIQKAARKLNDDDAFQLHEKLKKFFERAF